MLETINMTTTEEGFTTTNSLQEPTRRALNFDGSFGKFISQHKVYHIKKDEVYSVENQIIYMSYICSEFFKHSI